MSSSTVLRVKRRLEDNPQDALVVMCKRLKTDTEDLSPSLFVFRGTVDNQESIKVKEITHKPYQSLKPTSNIENIIRKLRKDRQEATCKQRYEIVNCSRGLKDNLTDDVEDVVDLIDLIKADEREINAQYTYDLYMSAKEDFDVSMLDNLVCIENLETDLIFYQEGKENNSSQDEDDDDSNDENNWRNDYPESDHSSIDEEAMVRAVQNVNMGDDDDLSSDTGEDRIYDDPLDTFQEDVQRYGEDYARYKAKVVQEHPDLSNSLIHSVPKRNESVGYKDDSDDDGFYYGKDNEADPFDEQSESDESDAYKPD